MIFGGKREFLARSLHRTGIAPFLNQLPGRDLLLVLTYHRIGSPDEDLFAPSVFSATTDEFNEQIAYLRRRDLLVTLEEAIAVVNGKAKSKTSRCRVLITLDDGYLDNYERAFPTLRALGVQGVFFLSTSIVGSAHIPWWDRIAYMMKTGRRRRFTLRYPAHLAVDVEQAGMKKSLQTVLGHYKLAANTDHARFMAEFSEEVQGENPPETRRRFLDWTEARAMISGGMAIGSHTHSHCVLSQLPPEEQFRELANSRSLLTHHLGGSSDVLAYPVGKTTSFSRQTQALARQAGYRAAFSSHGGTNRPGAIHAFDVKRNSVGHQSWARFQVQTSICRVTGNYWP